MMVIADTYGPLLYVLKVCLELAIDPQYSPKRKVTWNSRLFFGDRGLMGMWDRKKKKLGLGGLAQVLSYVYKFIKQYSISISSFLFFGKQKPDCVFKRYKELLGLHVAGYRLPWNISPVHTCKVDS